MSNIKTRLRLPGRKAKDERHMNPYPTQTHSTDSNNYGEPAVKPYMSHPALNMVVQPLNHRYHHSEESPANPPPPKNEELPLPTQPSQQTFPRRSIPAALVSGMRTGAQATPSAHGMDQMTYNSRFRSQQLLASGASENPGQSTPTPEIVISNSPESVAQRSYLGLPSTSSGVQGPNGYDGTGDPSSLGIVTTHNHSHVRLKSLPNLPNPHPSTNSSDSPTPIVSPPFLPAKFATSTFASVLSVPQAHHAKSLPPTPPSSPPSTITTTSYPPGTFTAQPLHPHEPVSPSPNSTLRNSARALSINRLSLTMPDGHSARFSPSIIMRTPPLTIPNLPPLPLIPSEPSSGTRRGRVGLKNMPELLHTRTAGEDHRQDDNDDDEGEVDHEDDEEREDDDNDAETLRDGASSLYHDNDSQDESSHPLQNDADVGLKPSLTSIRKMHSQSSLRVGNEYSGLPMVDRSRMDVDFSFLDRPANSSSTSLKGKGKAPSHGSNSERTPTSSSMQYDYFSPHGVQKQWAREDRAQSEQTQLQAEDSRHIRQGASALPTRPPWGGNTPVRMVFPPPASSIAFISGSPMLSGQDSLSPFPPMLPHNHDAKRMPIRPGMYKHSSVSLIDIHAVEKKEMVEEMVRDAEEEAVVEEKERRRRSVRISVKAKGKCKESDMPPSVFEAPPPTPSPIQVGGVEREDGKRMSKAAAYETGPHRLRRRRSMPSFVANSNPPPYPAFERVTHGLPAQLHIQPRDDEGRERLPAYSNDVYLKSVVPLKMEFVSAGVQAKDRKWRRVVCVLEGTVLKIYRCPANVAGVSVLGSWWERKVGVGDVSTGDTMNGTTGASGSASAAAGVRTQQEEAVPKGGNPLGQTELQVPAPSPPSALPRSRPPVPPPPPTSSSRSRLGLVNFLKPGRTHHRSTSDMQVPTRPRSPRASLNIPTGTSSSNTSSRSHSPVTPFSGSTMSLSSHNSTPQSVPTTSSSSHFRSGQRGDSIDGSMVSTDLKPMDLIRAYTMQHAESGLGNDYVKRKNVIRVRVEGEQFLFQAKNVADVVAWIEVCGISLRCLALAHLAAIAASQGLQASANIALDLDERPMPKGPLFPRWVLLCFTGEAVD